MRTNPLPRMLSAVAAFVLAAALVAACGDDDDIADDLRDDAEELTDDVRDDLDDLVDDVTPGDAEVTIDDFAFSPDALTVDAGTTVTFVNDQSVLHTVTSGTPGDPSGAFAEQVEPGGSAEITFDDAGTYEYFCEFHNQMTGSVTVE